MRRYASFIILSCAFFAALLSFIGDGSIENLNSLRKDLRMQQKDNADLTAEVLAKKELINNLKTDDRTLEKAARNNLGLARPDDLVFIFQDK